MGIRAGGAKRVIKPCQALACPRQAIGPGRKETRSGLNLLIGSVGILDGRLGFFEEREGDADLEGALGIQIEQEICTANGFVGAALLVEECAKLSEDARM